MLVDDPNRELRNPTLSNQIAHEIGFYLEQSEAVTQIVPQSRVVSLRESLGRDFDATPVDEIGKRLDAEQVIHVEIESVTLRPDLVLYHPKASVKVKLIDAVKSKRLFPADTTGRDPGFTLHPELRPKIKERVSQNSSAVISQMLARRIARDVARLFHDYQPHLVGDPFED